MRSEWGRVVNNYIVIIETASGDWSTKAYGPMSQLEANVLRDAAEDQGALAKVVQLAHPPARFNTYQVAEVEDD